MSRERGQEGGKEYKKIHFHNESTPLSRGYRIVVDKINYCYPLVFYI